MTWPHPLLWTPLPDQGGGWQCLQPLPAAGIYSDAAYRDVGEGVSFLPAVWNDARVSFSLAVARVPQSITRDLGVYLWWWEGKRPGVFQGWAVGRDSSTVGAKPLSQIKDSPELPGPAALPARLAWAPLG